jgi:hypothetical protein
MLKEPRGTTICIRDRSDQLCFVYAGADRGVMINPAVFLDSTGLFDQNLVIVQDRWNAYYQCGVSPELSSFDALLEWQHEFRASLSHVTRVFCVGACMGGYAAIAFGHLLRVEEVWAFGAVTLLPDGVDRRRAQAHADLTARIAASRASAAADDRPAPGPLPALGEVPADRADLSLALRHSNGVTRYNLFFHEQHHAHAEAARRLAACENVSLRPQPGDAYNIVQTLLDQALLRVVMIPHRSTEHVRDGPRR